VFAHLFIDPVKSPENVFKAVAEYKIVGGSDVPSKVVPFPGCSDLSWGPDAVLLQYGLKPHNKEALLQAPKGHVDVTFDKSHPEVRVYARLVRDGVPDGDLKRSVTVKSDSDKVMYTPSYDKRCLTPPYIGSMCDADNVTCISLFAYFVLTL